MNYWHSRIVELEAKALNLTNEVARSHNATAAWNYLLKTASAVLKKEYARFLKEVRRTIITTSRYGSASKEGADDFVQHYTNVGRFSVAYRSGNKLVRGFPNENGSVYNIPDEIEHSGPAVAFLSFDTSTGCGAAEWSAAGLRIPNYFKYEHDGMVWYHDDIVGAAMTESGRSLSSLLDDFKSQVSDQLRMERQRDELRKVQNTIDAYRRAPETWSKVSLESEVEAEILQMMDAFVCGRGVGGLLLKGRPGTGKTLLARTIAKTLGVTLIDANVTTLKQQNIGASSQAVKKLWERLTESAPAILFVDEADALFPRRGGNNSDTTTAELTNALLSLWSGDEKNIWVIAASNRPDLLDDAVLSRLSRQTELRLPNAAARRAIILRELSARGMEVVSMPSSIETLTQGLSGRDLRSLVLSLDQGYGACDWEVLTRKMRSAHSPDVGTDASWNNLVLPEPTKQRLMTICSVMTDVEGWRAVGVHAPTGVLLEGPPGTGKTQIARTIANENSMGFVMVTSADLLGQYVGHSAANVKHSFERARAVAPAVLFIDELDIVAPNRVKGSAFTAEVVGQLLQEMDGLSKSQSHVLVLAATNAKQQIDTAILNRFSDVVAIGLPDEAGRLEILKQHIRATKSSIEDAQLGSLLEISRGLSGRELKNWVQTAQQQAVQRASSLGSPKHYRLEYFDLIQNVPNSECSQSTTC